jgi:antitoxin MazE
MKGAEMMKITRWGHSIGLRLPCEVAQAAGLKPGDYVYVRLLDSGDIRVRPAKNVQPAHPAAAADGEMNMAEATLPAAVVTTW